MSLLIKSFFLILTWTIIFVAGNVDTCGGCCSKKKAAQTDSSSQNTTIAVTNDPPLPDRPEANLVSMDKLKNYCTSAPTASAPCALYKICSNLGDKAPSAICGTTPITMLICQVDKDTKYPGSNELCQDLTEKCSNNKCNGLGWPLFRTSGRFQMGIFKMCDYHAKRNENMVGCDTCTIPPTGIIENMDDNDWDKLNLTCNSFETYGQMCSSMPGMGACQIWRDMCATIPNAANTFPKWCDAEAMDAKNIHYNPALSQEKDKTNQPVLQSQPSTNNVLVSSASSIILNGIAIIIVLLAM